MENYVELMIFMALFSSIMINDIINIYNVSALLYACFVNIFIKL
jgi:hypothetical protein